MTSAAWLRATIPARILPQLVITEFQSFVDAQDENLSTEAMQVIQWEQRRVHVVGTECHGGLKTVERRR
jgi:hypothetical protein